MPTPLKTRVLLADDHARRPQRPADGARRTAGHRGGRGGGRRRRGGANWRSPEDIDLAILDVAMPRMTGLQAAAELHRRRPELRVLILSMYDNEQYFFEALKAGASGYVLKSAANRDLVEAIRASMRGEPFLYPAAVTALIRDYLERARRGESGAGGPADPARAGGRQADRRGPHERGDRRAPGDQQEDGRAPPREHPREAGDAQPRRADALRDPPRASSSPESITRRPDWDRLAGAGEACASATTSRRRSTSRCALAALY